MKNLIGKIRNLEMGGMKSRGTYLSLTVLMSFFSTLALTLDLNNPIVKTPEKAVKTLEKLKILIQRLIDSFPLASWNTCILLVVFSFFFYTIYKKHYSVRTRRTGSILSLIFAVSCVLGFSYMCTNSWDLVFGGKLQFAKSFTAGIGYFFISRACLILFFEFVMPRFARDSKKELKFLTSNRKSFLFAFFILILAWLPYLVILSPGSLTGDAQDEISQLYGDKENGRSYKSIQLINEDSTFSNHHPVLYTLILWGFVKIGGLFGNLSVGIMLYSIVQVIFTAAVYSYMLYYLAKIKVPNIFRVMGLVFLAIWPVNASYVVTVTKDSLFTPLFVLVVIMLYDLLRFPQNILKSKKKMFGSIIFLLLFSCIRNNGIYLLLMTMVVMLFALRKYWKQILILFAVPVAFYMIVITKILFPAFEIAPGSKREMLSIPFQQTARYIKEWGDTLTPEEESAIKKVLAKGGDIYYLKDWYKPYISDPVKNHYNKYATSEDLKQYFKVWFQMFLKHPTTYLQATLNQNYYLVYPSKTLGVFRLKVQDKFYTYGIENFKVFDGARNMLSRILYTMQKIPITEWFLGIPFYMWLLFILFAYSWKQKHYHKMAMFSLPFFNILIMLAGPVIIMRYSYTMIVCIPFLWGICAQPKDITAIEECSKQPEITES